MTNFLKLTLILAVSFFALFGCANLDEELKEDLTAEEAKIVLEESTDVDALLAVVYDNFKSPMQDQARLFSLQQHTTDETMGPTRGPDWDDNGIWRVLHNHSWDADHLFMKDTFNELLRAVFNSTQVLAFNASDSQIAEAKFLRAFAMFHVNDLWGQVPFREPGENLLQAPNVLQEKDAIDFIISEVEAGMSALPTGSIHKANPDAARALLAKAYLNRGVYGSRANPQFDAGDMAKVIQYCDEIINSGNYSLASNFYDNFRPDNNTASPELIFAHDNIGGNNSGNVRARWHCGMHYNQNPSGWNGFCTISDFYDKFDDNDIRKSYTDPDLQAKSGLTLGFLEGQQFDADGNALQDRKGNPLAFTREVSLVETGDNLEITGVRVVKWTPDFDGGDHADNDFTYYRYADILLMKAEALMRTGDNAGALALVNELRSARGNAELSALSEEALLDERGFELYWENQRRTDLIRFGKFLDAWTEKPASGAERLVFPIPNEALAANPNLTQNPGY